MDWTAIGAVLIALVSLLYTFLKDRRSKLVDPVDNYIHLVEDLTSEGERLKREQADMDKELQKLRRELALAGWAVGYARMLERDHEKERRDWMEERARLRSRIATLQAQVKSAAPDSESS